MKAFDAARAAFDGWSRTPFTERQAIVERYRDIALQAKPRMAELIAKETGKVLWDATGEAGAVSAKADISLASYNDRTGHLARDTAFGQASLHHRAHGVMAVLGPYNFPAHLPNGQILPALIAGNTVVFKPSELTPAVGQALVELYVEAGFPKGVINLVQGGRETGAAVLNNPELDGVLFTGSAGTGAYIHKLFGGRPEIILALEMGGNNPLIVWDAKDADAAASIALQSAFITSGQRCTCARRLILPKGRAGDEMLAALVEMTKNLKLGAWNDDVTIGPVVSAQVAEQVIARANELEVLGASPIVSAKISEQGAAFIEPGIYDVTGCTVPDEEIFGPVLQVVRVGSWDEAITVANDTKYGLAAGLVSNDKELWSDFKMRIRAGIVNFNRPTTGAASFLPFGGPGASGNHNPGAYYAADFCAWPMASQVADEPERLLMAGMS
jgi:succinylglutamic semialdehyde dehydrogenase